MNAITGKQLEFPKFFDDDTKLVLYAPKGYKFDGATIPFNIGKVVLVDTAFETVLSAFAKTCWLHVNFIMTSETKTKNIYLAHLKMIFPNFNSLIFTN